MSTLRDFVANCIAECNCRGGLKTSSDAEVLLLKFAEKLDADGVGDGGGGSVGGSDKIEVVVDIQKKTVTTGDVPLADVFTLIQNEGWDTVNVRLVNNGKPMSFISVSAYLPLWIKLYYIALEIDGSTQTPGLKYRDVLVESSGTVTVETSSKFTGVLV